MIGSNDTPSLFQPFSGEVSAEVRVNIPRTNFDVGAQLSIVSDNIGNSTYRHNHHTLYFDYNWRDIAEPITIFTGLGLGYGEIFEREDGDYYAQKFVVAPRIGVEFLSTLRLTLDSKLTSEGHYFVGLILGVVFGGWKKD